MVRLRTHLEQGGTTGTLLRRATKSSHTCPQTAQSTEGDHPRKSCRPSLTFKAFLMLLVSLPNKPTEAPMEHAQRQGGRLSLKNDHIQLLTKCSLCRLYSKAPLDLYAWLRVQCVTSGCIVLNPFRLRGSRAVREDSACKHRKLTRKPRA